MLSFSVLPHQREFIKSNANTMIVGGYGSAKSHAGTLKTILRKLQYPTKNVAYYLPTYGLIKDIAFDKFPSILEELGIKYKLNKSDKEIHLDNYGTIIFRSMDNPETIIGYEVAYSLIDEADILPMDKMQRVYTKILGRNRAVEDANVDAVSTPEGYKWLYQQSKSGHFKVIKAKTQDNKFLPQSYIKELKEQYPPELLQAYLEGEFVNLTTGTIYSYFNRSKHNTDIIENEYEELFIGQDFNIGGCVSIVYIVRGSTIIAIDEYESYDTRSIIENTISKYPNRSISFYPDASGQARKTSASDTDISMLSEAGFSIYVDSQNPRVKDRHNSVHKKMNTGELLINCNRCPKLAEAFEQHSFDKQGMPEKYSGSGTVDDYTDAGTYPISYRYPIIQPMHTSKISGI